MIKQLIEAAMSYLRKHYEGKAKRERLRREELAELDAIIHENKVDEFNADLRGRVRTKQPTVKISLEPDGKRTIT